MPINTITSDDTLTLFGRVITDLAEGDTSQISFPNDMVDVKTGKNKNTIFSKNETGNNAILTMRVMRGSSDDQFLQGKLIAQSNDFPATVLAYGSFVKRLGDGQGVVVSDSYTLSAGVFTRPVDGKENVEGNIDQAVAVYNLKFASAERGIK